MLCTMVRDDHITGCSVSTSLADAKRLLQMCGPLTQSRVRRCCTAERARPSRQVPWCMVLVTADVAGLTPAAAGCSAAGTQGRCGPQQHLVQSTKALGRVCARRLRHHLQGELAPQESHSIRQILHSC